MPLILPGDVAPTPGWDPPLNHRIGGGTFLNGIDVYYDFDWPAVFGHDRAQFRNGQCLAQLAQETCPEDKSPALLLTAKADVLEHPITTDSQFFLVVNLPRYLKKATGNAAVSYYAQELKSEIARIEELDRLAARPEILEAVLTVERVAEWVAGNDERREELRAALTREERSNGDVHINRIVAAIDSIRGLELDAEAVESLATFFGPGTSPEHRVNVLRTVTEDTEGRFITGEVLADRTPDRIADARAAMAAYQVLLDDPDTGETAMQEFIEKNLWLLGLDYAKMVPQQRLLGGTMDFALERFDGFQDVLELKDPRDPIVTVSRADTDEGPAPPPSAYALSPDLAGALAQVHAYRDRLTRHAEANQDLLGLPLSRDPRIIIVVGRVDRLSERSQRVLRELNKSLHRVEIIPYDLLAKRAEAILKNVDRYLLAVQEPLDDGG